MVKVGLRVGFFFKSRGMITGVFQARPHTPIQGQRHDQEQTIQAIRIAQLGGFQVKAPTFDVREQRLDAPAMW